MDTQVSSLKIRVTLTVIVFVKPPSCWPAAERRAEAAWHRFSGERATAADGLRKLRPRGRMASGQRDGRLPDGELVQFPEGELVLNPCAALAKITWKAEDLVVVLAED